MSFALGSRSQYSRLTARDGLNWGEMRMARGSVRKTVGRPRRGEQGGDPPSASTRSGSEMAAGRDVNGWVVEDVEGDGVGVAADIETVPEAVEAHEAYREDKEDAKLVAKNRETGEVAVMEWDHRWTEGYEARMRRRIDDAVDGLKLRHGETMPVTMITLTAHQTDRWGNQRPMLEVLEDIKEGFDKFRDVLRRRCEGSDVEKLVGYGPHSTGYPHVHIIIFGAYLPNLSEDVQKFWVEKYGVGGEEAHREAVEAVRSTEVERPAEYVKKNYLGDKHKWEEEGDGGITGLQVFQALMWVSGAKGITMSQGLADAISVGSGSDSPWEFVGSVSGIGCGVYEGEDAERVADRAGSTRSTAGKLADEVAPRSGNTVE